MAPPLGKLPHLDGIFRDFIPFTQRELPVLCRDGHHTEIHLRTQPPVQFDLAIAEVTAFLQRQEVQEPEVDRLLHLVNERRREEHERRMRLHQPHPPRVMRIGIGVEQERKQALLADELPLRNLQHCARIHTRNCPGAPSEQIGEYAGHKDRGVSVDDLKHRPGNSKPERFPPPGCGSSNSFPCRSLARKLARAHATQFSRRETATGKKRLERCRTDPRLRLTVHNDK